MGRHYVLIRLQLLWNRGWVRRRQVFFSAGRLRMGKQGQDSTLLVMLRSTQVLIQVAHDAHLL
jgi:hypothetical protein